jgi:hypothetical protein
MVARFWVGGSGIWNATDKTHWAASSGGAGGQSVPGPNDTVTFDRNSGGGTVMVDHPSLVLLSFMMSDFGGFVDFATNNIQITLSAPDDAETEE